MNDEVAIKNWLTCDHEFNKDNNSMIVKCSHQCGAFYNIKYKCVFKKREKDNGSN